MPIGTSANVRIAEHNECDRVGDYHGLAKIPSHPESRQARPNWMAVEQDFLGIDARVGAIAAQEPLDFSVPDFEMTQSHSAGS